MANKKTKKNIEIDSEELKNETKNTVNDVKNTIKNVDIKSDAKYTSGFVTSFFKNPLTTLENLANDKKNKHFKYAIIMLVIWLATIFIHTIASNQWAWSLIGFNFVNTIKALLAPIIGLVVFALILYFFQKQSGKKSLTNIITILTISTTPYIIASVINLVTIFSRDFAHLSQPLLILSEILTVIFTYFGVKNLIDNDDEGYLKTFIKIEAVYYLAYFLISFLGIYMPIL